MIVIRSFDVNKRKIYLLRIFSGRRSNTNTAGAEIDDLKGGVAGGSILSGVLKLFVAFTAPDGTRPNLKSVETKSR